MTLESHRPPYIHHIPGRLRVRCAPIRGRAELAPYLKASLEALPGIASVEVNSLTGSVKVQYRQGHTTADAILEWLKQQGLTASDAKVPAKTERELELPSLPPGYGSALARKLASVALEKAIERSVVLLVASLL
ncbi:MAG TPA: hypothetical protein VE621_07280 [Bryobacteraceae bacterium]|nr:hypothetical protein [Bryobacteraceae bacterium]